MGLTYNYISAVRGHVRNLLALHSHVGLPERERVDIVRLEVRQTVIDKSMGALVAPHSVNHVKELSVGLEAPVVLRDLRCGVICPVEPGSK